MIMAACVGETPEQRVASAKQMMEKNDNAAAIIELKNALQSNSGLSEARFLLGKALFATGDLGGAAVELKRAADSGYTGEDLPVLFSQLYLQASQYDKLIAAYGQTKLQSPALMVKLQVALATAYGVLERNQDSRAAIDEALRLEPGNVQAQLIKVRLTASQEGLDKALAELSKMLDAHPESSESWQLKAEFLLRQPCQT